MHMKAREVIGACEEIKTAEVKKKWLNEGGFRKEFRSEEKITVITDTSSL